MNEEPSLDDISRLRASQKTFKRTADQLNESKIAYWRNVAGPAVDFMLKDRAYALNCLMNADPSIRRVGLSVLVSHWQSANSHDVIEQCEKMAFHDENDVVRSVALRLLGECYQNSDDKRIGRMLAEVVGREQQHLECRSGAYLALFRLRGLFADWPGRMSSPPTLFSFPEHVDWSMVGTFLDEARIPIKVDPLAQVVSFLSQESREALVHYQKGVEAYESKDYDAALKFFAESIKYRPEAAGAFYMRGRTYVGLGKLDDAIAEFTKAIDLSPFSSDTYLWRSLAYRQKGQVNLAEDDYKKAMDIEKKLDSDK